MAQKRATSTEALVNAAARVFLEKGFEVSTIDDVAREAGVSKPTVYQYAKSKQWLLDEIVRLMCQDMEKAQLRMYSDPAPAIVRLHWLMELNIELAIEYRNSYRVTLSEQTALSPAARDEFRLWARRTTTRFAELLTECRQDGTFTWHGDIMVARQPHHLDADVHASVVPPTRQRGSLRPSPWDDKSRNYCPVLSLPQTCRHGRGRGAGHALQSSRRGVILESGGGHRSSPPDVHSLNQTATCVRLVKPSLTRMCSTCASAVRWEMTRLLAISWLLRP